jgi:dTDP-4-dehydrorhamnose reductase
LNDKTRVLIIGASGRIGKEIYKIFDNDINKLFFNVFGTYCNHPLSELEKLDITDIESVKNLINKIKPEIVIHAAGMVYPIKCEENKKLAWKINVIGTKNLLECCKDIGSKIVYISTDYVFDGKNNPYDELDQTNPLNYYGQTKLESEKLILSINEYLIIRTAWVNDVEKNSSSFIMQVINSLKNNEVFSVPFDQYGSPTITSNLSEIIFELIQKNQKGIFHVTGLTYIDRYNFAIKIAEVFLLNRKLIKKISTAELNQKIKRPLEVNLDLKKLKSIITTKIFSLDEQLDLMKKTSKF